MALKLEWRLNYSKYGSSVAAVAVLITDVRVSAGLTPRGPVRRLSLRSNVDSFFVSEAAVGRGISLVLRQAIHSISLYHTVSSSLVPSSPSCSICHLNLDHTHSRRVRCVDAFH